MPRTRADPVPRSRGEPPTLLLERFRNPERHTHTGLRRQRRRRCPVRLRRRQLRPGESRQVAPCGLLSEEPPGPPLRLLAWGGNSGSQSRPGVALRTQLQTRLVLEVIAPQGAQSVWI